MSSLPPEAQVKYNALSEGIRNAKQGGRFFGYFSVVELEAQRLKLIKKLSRNGWGDLASALSDASINYRDACLHAWSQFRGKPFDFRWLNNLRWLWRAFLCFWRTLLCLNATVSTEKKL